MAAAAPVTRPKGIDRTRQRADEALSVPYRELPAEEHDVLDATALLGLLSGIVGIFMKHRGLCLVSLLTSLYTVANGRAAQEGSKSYLSFAVMGLLMCYVQMGMVPSSAAAGSGTS